MTHSLPATRPRNLSEGQVYTLVIGLLVALLLLALTLPSLFRAPVEDSDNHDDSTNVQVVP